MARPIEYDKVQVLNKAMVTFWNHGYESTSMKDLVEATGLTTRSMYNIFGSKNGLFQASLKWYYDNFAVNVFTELCEENGLQAIRNFFGKIIVGFETSNGCFYTNTLCDKSNIDDVSIGIVEKYFMDLERVFEDKLKYAVEYEGYKDDPSTKAIQLVIIVQGLSVYTKRYESTETRRKVMNELLSTMSI